MDAVGGLVVGKYKLCISACVIMICLLFAVLVKHCDATGLKKRRVVLLGASVGRAWDFPNLSTRIGRQNYIFEYEGVYAFDKTPALARLLQRVDNKPDAIIIKECAAYFPGKLSEYKRIIKKQVNSIKRHQVVPILATTVPVTNPPFGSLFWVKDLVKIVWPNKLRIKFRQEPIQEFNDWLISYAKEQDVVILDLEKAVRISDADRRLSSRYTSGDGLHLNEHAYSVLDQIICPTLDKVKWAQR